MVMAPLDLHNKEFKRVFRGYSEEEVDGFLAVLLKDYEEIYKENFILKEQLEKKDGNIYEYKQIEDTLKETLVVAQKTAEDVKTAANKEAETTLTQAHKEAANLIKEAELKAQQMISRAEHDGQEIMRKYEDVAKQTQVYKTKLRALLNAQLELLDGSLETESPAQPYPKQEIAVGLED